MCDAYNRQYGTSFIPVMPTNLYGIGDNFDLQNSHDPAGADPQVPPGQAGASQRLGRHCPRRRPLWLNPR